MAAPVRSIADLPQAVAELRGAQAQLFASVLHVEAAEGVLRAPASMHPWLRQQFGSLDAVERQTIIRVTNVVTQESALFNPLRSQRPQPRPAPRRPDPSTDLLARPLESTPEDGFGRIQGRHCITASNAAKADGYHALVVFAEPDPLAFNEDRVLDYLETGWRWAGAAHAEDPEARFYLFAWNSSPRAGASLPHGHAQVLLGRRRHYGKVEAQRRDAARYQKQHRRSYFDALYEAHRMVGCAFESDGLRVLASLTPIKEKEVVLMAPAQGVELARGVHRLLSAFRDSLSVVAFNLALWLPPLGPPDPLWEGFPAIARAVDRGDPANPTADIAALELYASPVVASDPFRVAQALREHFGL